MHIADKMRAEATSVDYGTRGWLDPLVGEFMKHIFYGYHLPDRWNSFSRDELELLYAQYLMEKEET